MKAPINYWIDEMAHHEYNILEELQSLNINLDEVLCFKINYEFKNSEHKVKGDLDIVLSGALVLPTWESKDKAKEILDFSFSLMRYDIDGEKLKGTIWMKDGTWYTLKVSINSSGYDDFSSFDVVYHKSPIIPTELL